MATLTIRLDDKLDRALTRLARKSGRTRSEVARDALRRQLLVQEFRQLRQETPALCRSGWLADG